MLGCKDVENVCKVLYIMFVLYITQYTLLVARQGDVSRKLNQAFHLVDSFNFNLVEDEIQIYIIYNMYLLNLMSCWKITFAMCLILCHIFILIIIRCCCCCCC